MEITLRDSQKHSTRYLADNCFYVVPAQDSCLLCSTFAEAIEHIPEDRRLLDPVALMSLIQYGYVCGNRTLVRGLSRLPLHSTIDSQGRIDTTRQLPHGVGSASPSEIAARLLDLLREEVETVVRDESEVVLLLSGGLDSRITAGILKQLQPIYGFSVKAVTWGAIESRDWVYADRICQLYGWKHINVPITVETAWDNIVQAVHYLGTEVTGIHLHGMCHLAEFIPKGVLILGSSYGDSVGRGAYQGVNIIRLRRQTPSNRWQLFYRDIYWRHFAELADDLSAPLQRGNCHTRQQAFEIGVQENYMRRQINQLMCCVCEDFRLYQVFTDEKVVEYMWSITPPLRDDRVYQSLIPMLDYELARMPWQKTGRALIEDAWQPEQSSLSKDFHNYPEWIRHDLKSRFEEYLFAETLRKQGYINRDRVVRLWEFYQADKFANYPKLFDRVSRLFARIVGVVILMEQYNVRAEHGVARKSFLDRSNTYTNYLCALENLKSEAKKRVHYAQSRGKL